MIFANKYKSVFVSGILICLFIIGLFYYWFALADRYIIFLYNHLKATPFDARTISRYWMSGFVASGATFIFYIVANWFLGRFAGIFYHNYSPPAWWQVWIFCIVPIGVGVLYITMTFNNPTLPLSIALVCAITTLLGLALALFTSSLATQKPIEFGWLTLIAMGLVPIFLLLRAIELPHIGLATIPVAYSIAAGGTLTGIIWSIALVRLQTRFYPIKHKGLAVKVYAIGLCLSFLLLPLFHYLLLTPPKFRYISVSANFFAVGIHIQILSLVVGVLVVIGLEQLQKKWQKYNLEEDGE